MSDTPRTDAAGFFVGLTPEEGEMVVPCDFARTLEREITTLREQIVELAALKSADYRHCRICGLVVDVSKQHTEPETEVFMRGIHQQLANAENSALDAAKRGAKPQ
jgi:hypothetical protein